MSCVSDNLSLRLRVPAIYHLRFFLNIYKEPAAPPALASGNKSTPPASRLMCDMSRARRVSCGVYLRSSNQFNTPWGYGVRMKVSRSAGAAAHARP